MKIEEIIEKNNELLKVAVKSAKITKRNLELELINNYSDELYGKITYLNSEINKASNLIDKSPSEGHKINAENYPESVDAKGDLNSKGKKRFNFLRKKFSFIRLFK